MKQTQDINETIKDSMTAKVVKEIKEVDNNVSNVIVPILRDTVADYRKVVTKLMVVILILILCLVSLGVAGYFIISRQIDRYNNFLSQFDYEDEIIQDVYADGNSSSTINDGISIDTKE